MSDETHDGRSADDRRSADDEGRAAFDGGRAATEHDRTAYDPDRDGSFSAWLRAGSAWEAATRHRFVEEYRAGELDDAVFERYLVQDYAFLEAGARVTALAAGQAHTMDEIGRLSDSLAVLTGGENDYFQRAFDDLGVSDARRRDPDRQPTTETFVDFVVRAGHEGSYEETLALLCAAEWVYLDWCSYAAGGEGGSDEKARSNDGARSNGGADSDGRAIANDAIDRWYLDEWLEIHTVDEFRDYTAWLCEQLDTYGPRLSPDRRDRVAEIFDRTVELEAAFFGMAYE